MKRFLTSLLGIAFCLALVPSSRAEEVDALITQEMKKHHIAGLSMKVLKEGKAVKTESYGMANLEWDIPTTEDTAFEIGSLTKQFTAACILLLAEDGQLSVDDAISLHLHDIPESWASITIRHLLTHTSGIKNYTGMEGFEFSKHLSQQDFIKKMSSVPLDFQPGDRFAYSNTGYNLLGFIIENVSGKSYWSFIHDRIFEPLGMNSTTSRNPGVIIPRRAAGYELSKDKQNKHINRDYDITDIFSAGAIVSTVDDISKWNAALDGNKFLNAASRKLWWTPTKLNNGKIQNYGFGWSLDPFENHKNIGHGGATSGFSATLQRFPDDKLSIIILTNADESGVATAIARKVAKLYFQDAVAAK